MSIENIISKSDCIISFAGMLENNNEMIKECVVKAIADNDAQFVYMHSMDDIDLKMFYTQFIKYEVGSEEGICALLLDTFVKNSDEKTQAFIDDLDVGYISAESSAGEEEFEEIYEKTSASKNAVLLIGDDILNHERIENIIKIICVIKKYSDVKVLAASAKVQEKIDTCINDNLEEIEELKSYNGTVVYFCDTKEEDSILLGSQSFARVAKINDGDDINVLFDAKSISKTFKVDKNMQGTIALINNDNSIEEGYVFKQVKIERK